MVPGESLRMATIHQEASLTPHKTGVMTAAKGAVPLGKTNDLKIIYTSITAIAVEGIDTAIDDNSSSNRNMAAATTVNAPDVGSSTKMTGASPRISVAKERRFFSPPEMPRMVLPCPPIGVLAHLPAIRFEGKKQRHSTRGKCGRVGEWESCVISFTAGLT